MDIKHRRKSPRRWIAEVWDEANDGLGNMYPDTYPEKVYVEINDWCVESFGYHARTAYHIFELRKKAHLDWFLLRWS